MRKIDANQPSSNILRWISPLITFYILVLFLIDQFFYPKPILPLIFYIIMVGNAILILVLTYYPDFFHKFGRFYNPVIIGLLVIGPIIASLLSTALQPPFVQPGPANGPEMETLRLVPLSFIALILVAWIYRMKEVLLFCFLVTLAQSTLVIFLKTQHPEILISPWYVVITIQFISFIIVGYFINLLVHQLKDQQIALKEANDHLVDYASTLENLTISRERNAMARELHDTVAHTLSGLSVQLETARAYLDVDPDKGKQMVEKSLEITRGGLQETRRALNSLRATPFDDLGLIIALKEIAENISNRGNLKLSLNLPLVDLNLPSAQEQVIYRITQEGLTNTLHHANAKTIELSLTRHKNEIHLLIIDDGIGFQTDQQFGEHFGLVGMRERAELVGADLQIFSKPGEGTQIKLIIRKNQ